MGGAASVAVVALAGCRDDGKSASATSTVVVAAPPLLQSEANEWEKLVGGSFLVAGEAGNVAATLSAVQRSGPDFNRPADLARHEGFLAFFEMDPRLVPQGGKVYQVSHPVRGAFELFLSVSSADSGKGVLHAVLN
jgi:hypothetical protein